MKQAGWPVRRRSLIPTLLATILISSALVYSFGRVGLSSAAGETVQAILSMVGLGESSQVVEATTRFFDQGWPPVISSEQETSRIEKFNREDLPWLSHIETREVPSISVEFVDGTVVEREVTETKEVLVKPVGYLQRVAWLMWETLEIALWGTIMAIACGFPLGMLGAKRICRVGPLVLLARSVCSLSRAIPELISALFFVLLFGFGPAAGVLALGLHSAGFLGKFFADDIDNTKPGPSDALACSGVGRFGVFLHALLPQVLPQYLAYIQYILERNVRAATVLGIVGAGGIGVELMGKWHNFQFGHATTVLIAIFLTVVILEAISQTLRMRWIQD
ncbi:Phosphate-import permease protein PhnE [Bremerella volcania]|uniref:Phosphate-import permease protein PhnE n=2 Tax=Bremerella volcania TaxID=2527984 RepID=A0A518CC60_9BACT|nr:Phosphate-import permease protein PhnE [Bremerella volcania]